MYLVQSEVHNCITFTKQGEAQFAKSVDLLHVLLARGPGPGTYAN
jgi:hypothetical protein